MNKFYEIKQMLSNQQVVKKYLGKPEKENRLGLWYKSPFRDEKTASFCVSEKGIHDFGDSQHYDIISFVARYFNTTQYNALKILINDFGLSLANEYETEKTIRLIKQKRIEEQIIKQKINQFWLDEFIKTSNELLINEKLIEIFKSCKKFSTLTILYNDNVRLNLEIERLINATDEEKEQMFLERFER